MTLIVPLRRHDGTVRAVAVIDDIDAWALDRRWHLTGTPGYAARRAPKGTKPAIIWLHKEILTRMGYVDFPMGDHKDRDPLNCRRSNLRPADAKLNAQNRVWTTVPGTLNRRLPDAQPRPCEHCGAEFTPRRKNPERRFCSRSCQRAHVLPLDRESQTRRARLPRPRKEVPKCALQTKQTG